MAELTNFLKWWIEFTYEHWFLTCVFAYFIFPSNQINIAWTNRKGDK